ncbi:MAG: tRNA pseudouridine(38-40) synthase TruA [Coprobacillus sp.]|nr:tRNA pseudouridine(38-40) synthase TruA [Coprobacillus sp.]
MRFKVVCAYNGSKFCGWEKQLTGVSVQEEIEKALSKVFDEPISIYGSGRTDAGVHALGQVFHFDSNKKMCTRKLKTSLNSLLNEDIQIISIGRVSDTFHARYSATSKEYLYVFKQDKKDPFNHDNLYLCPYELDLEAMKTASKLFIGRHNFRNFTSKDEDEFNFVREITSIKFGVKDDINIVTFKGNGFMRYEVRYIVGTLLEVGKGRIDSSFIKERLKEDGERNIVSYKASPNGLYLKKVCY